MFLECYARGRRTGRRYVCHACEKVSKLLRGNDPPRPEGWAQKTELVYDAKGPHPRRAGFVENYYCPTCRSEGCSAYTVAVVLRRIADRERRRQRAAQGDAGAANRHVGERPDRLLPPAPARPRRGPGPVR